MQRAHNPLSSDLILLERVESYIRGTYNYARVIAPRSLILSASIDASHAVHADKKSQAGFVLMLGGAVITASSYKLKLVASSSTQSELGALSTNIDTILWARHWLIEKGYDQDTTRIAQDNQSTPGLQSTGR